jgi:alpha/beta superfamily hydrolase
MEATVRIEVPGGPRLEGKLAVSDGSNAGLVLCHPHPLYGGDMENPVIVRAADVAREASLATLRFNFRGVGGSAGAYGHGEAEGEDVTAALDVLADRMRGRARLGLVGYSFGAWVAARVTAGDPRVAGLCLIAPPLAMFDFAGLDGSRGAPLLVAGTRDPYCSVADLERLAARLPGAEAVMIEGADHFFFGKLFPLGEALRRWLEGWTRS